MPAEQWVLVLDLASRWQFDAIRDVALKQLNAGLSHGSPTLALQLAAAHRHALDEYYWRVFALLCERSAALYPEEGEILGVCEAVHISAIREKLRGGAKGRAIFESAKRIELTGDQQRMIRSEPQSKPDPGAFTPGQAGQSKLTSSQSGSSGATLDRNIPQSTCQFVALKFDRAPNLLHQNCTASFLPGWNKV